MMPSPSMTSCMEGSGVYVTNKDLLPDLWWVVPLSIIILRDVDRRGDYGIVLITRATILAEEIS